MKKEKVRGARQKGIPLFSLFLERGKKHQYAVSSKNNG
jgi:hypothetical protein